MPRVKFDNDNMDLEFDLLPDLEEMPKSILKKSSLSFSLNEPKKKVIREREEGRQKERKERKVNENEITNWTALAIKEGEGHKFKKDRNYHKHYINPCVMIGVVGPTGSGKSNWICEFLSRKQESFYQIIYFTASTSDEPLLNYLQKCIKGIEILDRAEQLPKFDNHIDDEDYKNKEKLIVFDDFINCSNKELKEIQRWFNSARKLGFTCVALAQNYQNIPTQIRRNIMIWVLFRLNDSVAISNIIRNHGTNEEKRRIKNAYLESTRQKGDFFIIDYTADNEHKYRHNFLEFIDI
jgi:hypothetical protein